MWKLNGCPRCNGDLLVYHCKHGWVENCLQCGYEQYLEDEFMLNKQYFKVVESLKHIKSESGAVT